MSKKVLIVGGVAGGASAAARLRRMDEKAEIIMFEKGMYISFANCGLPYYIGGAIKERKNLLVQTAEAMKARFNIDVKELSEVTKIDRHRKVVEVRNIKDGSIYEESYDVLVLSPGASPVKPPIPGIDSPNIYTLRDIPDTDSIKSFLDEKKPQNAVVVGGGFIGLEMAENLHSAGLKVDIVEALDQVMAPLDYEMAAIVHNHIRSKGCGLHLKDGVKAFEPEGNRTVVVLQSGKRIPADMIILSIGVKPNNTLAREAGLEIGVTGGIKVNEYLQTSDPNIYALGDAVEVTDYISGNPALIPLAGPANKQGRIVADNIAGRRETYKGTQGTAIAKVFDMAAASTGVNEKTLKKLGKELGKDYITTITHSASHAGYYPGGSAMAIKLIYTLQGRVLGAQIAGYDGVDKRIDDIAIAVRHRMTVHDLQEFELAYAPPFSSAKDPVNMAGYVGSNVLNGDVKVAYWYEAMNADMSRTFLLDVREPSEYQMGHIPNAVNIPLDQIRSRLKEIPKDKEIIVNCRVGLRSYIGVRIMMQNGFDNVRNLSGGYKTYSAVEADMKSI
ncbi:MAG TPA: FAD-dependent oxidoreductase [Bacillota bacterium]|nr:FAD-dependent oxidoreductase [Bacillota bacterium]HQI17171.1 FAD-dependent oxidoreductase [Bacillota bacterium]HQJ38054.1 FAD-dependent oxidoreductase [Bacillota bacterium]HRS20996.1 FAD-dependent oxidoreductase [Clostridia bacterium]HRU41195.1 FAD-dependent oxidoreductase [Candidatus Diapherotrites archaeon]